MFHQSGGRGQKPKGFKVKQALQFGLLLAVCIWLFYKLQHSDEKGSSYGDSAERRNGKEFQTIDLGRKGMASIDAGTVKMFRDRNGVEGVSEREEVGTDGDDVVVHEVNEDLMGSIVNGEGEHEVELNEDNVEGNVTNHDEAVDEKELNKDGNEGEAMGADIGEAEPNRREQDYEGNEKIDTVDKMQLQPSQSEPRSAVDTSETEDGVDSFQDVNGVPPDGHQLVKSSPYLDRADEPNASSDNESGHGENRTEHEDMDKSSQLDGGVDEEVQFSNKGTDSENNEGSGSLQKLISFTRPTLHDNEHSEHK